MRDMEESTGVLGQSRLDTKTSVTWLVRGWKGCAAQLAEECEMC